MDKKTKENDNNKIIQHYKETIYEILIDKYNIKQF